MIGRIAIDLDGTITKDPMQFLEVCHILREGGWEVWIVSARPESHRGIIRDYIDNNGFDSFPLAVTDGIAKAYFMETQKLEVDIWIDDNPSSITVDRNHVVEG